MSVLKYGLSLLLLCHAVATPAAELRIAVHQGVLDQYIHLLGHQRPDRIQHYGRLKRDLLELLLLMQAMQRIDLDRDVKLVAVDAYARQLTQLKKGNVFAIGSLLWRDELSRVKSDLFITMPLLNTGDTVWGVYGLASNPKLAAVHKTADLSGLRALTNTSWPRDVHVLQQLGAQIEDVKQWESLKKMLVAGRADFTLLPFAPTPDMTLQWDGVPIVPVSGIKIGIPGERVYALSRHDTAAASTHIKLNRAIRQMIQSGQIRRAFREAGYIDDPRIRRWRQLDMH